MDASEAALRRHLAEARFLSGEFDGRWRLIEVVWPHATFGVTAKGEYLFYVRLDCSSYPLRAPTGTLWDIRRNAMLDFRFWPRGPLCSEVFRTDWQGGNALYLPCDHVTLATHDASWPRRWPSMVWRPEIGITCYLKVVHDILQDPEISYVKSEGAEVTVA